MGFVGLDSKKLIKSSVYIRKNDIETYDSFLNPFTIPSIEDSFYDLGYLDTVPLNSKLPGTTNSVYINLF